MYLIPKFVSNFPKYFSWHIKEIETDKFVIRRFNFYCLIFLFPIIGWLIFIVASLTEKHLFIWQYKERYCDDWTALAEIGTEKHSTFNEAYKSWVSFGLRKKCRNLKTILDPQKEFEKLQSEVH